jgi:hypothetical protein
MPELEDPVNAIEMGGWYHETSPDQTCELVPGSEAASLNSAHNPGPIQPSRRCTPSVKSAHSKCSLPVPLENLEMFERMGVSFPT